MEQLKPERVIAPVMVWEKRKRELFADMMLIVIDKSKTHKEKERAIDALFNGRTQVYYDELIEAGIHLLQSVKALQ